MGWWVIEGPDQCGKTNLALGLQRRGWHYQKCTEADTHRELARRMAALLRVRDVVWDRAHLSEMVHHPERWDPIAARTIEGMLSSIYARCTLLTVRHGPPEGFEHTEEEHNALVARFASMAAWSNLQWFHGWPDPMPGARVPDFEEDPPEEPWWA